MNLNFGKREQIVVILVSGIVLIAGLHLFSFSRRATEFARVYEELDGYWGDVERLRVLNNPRLLDDYESDTELVEVAYNDALTSLGLTLEEVWKIPSFNSFVLDPPAPPETEPEEADKLKWEQLETVRQEKYDQQIELVLDEIKRLQGFDNRRRTNQAGETDMSFLRENTDGAVYRWQLPIALPEGLQGGRLEDAIVAAGNILPLLRQVGNSALREQQREIYEKYLWQMGINNHLYRLPAGQLGLLVLGEFVPLIHKISYAMLLEEALKDSRLTRKITREYLYDLLEITLPLEPLVDPRRDIKETMEISQMYFLYHQLRFLNEFLEIAVQSGVLEVSMVKLGEAGYLVDIQEEDGSLPWADPPKDGAPAPRAEPTPRPNPYVLPPPGAGADSDPDAIASFRLASARGEFDIGYTLPLTLQFRSSNTSGWKFIYEVLRQIRLVELDEFEVQPARDVSDTVDVWYEVRFLVVPWLFVLDEPGQPI